MKTKIVNFKCTEIEKQRIIDAAKKENMFYTSWIRKIALDKADEIVHKNRVE